MQYKAHILNSAMEPHVDAKQSELKAYWQYIDKVWQPKNQLQVDPLLKSYCDMLKTMSIT